MAGLKAITAASVRDLSPAELAAQQKNGGTSNPGGLNEDAEKKLLLAKLKARARELGSDTSFPNQLKAREEMTDSLRDKLNRDPATERATEEQLKLLFYAVP